MNDKWTCPRCGLEGDHLRSPDPSRCLHCCRVDAASDLYKALATLTEFLNQRDVEVLTPEGAWAEFTFTMDSAARALAKARGE